MPPSKKVEREAGRRYLRKAQEFLRSASEALGRSDWNAAGMLAIHAGISANDSYLSWVHGLRSTSKDHLEAVALLGTMGGPAIEARAVTLRRLLKKKSMVEYEDRLLTEREAREALARAERLVAWAREAVKASAR